MSQVLEGTWEEIVRQADRLAGKRVRVTVLNDAETASRRGMICFGMFPQLGELTEDDFRIAEFHGDPDDGLDWS